MKSRLLLRGVLLALSIGIMGVGAAQTPIIVGEFCQNVTQTAATIGFRYHCYNQRCKTWTEYGKSSNLSDAVKTAERDELHNGPTNYVSVGTYQYDVHGLVPGTVYYFRGTLKYFADDTHTKTGTLYTKIGFLRTAPIPTPTPSPNISNTPSASLSARVDTQAIHLTLHCDTGPYTGQCRIAWATTPRLTLSHPLETQIVSPTLGGVTLHATFPLSKVPDRTKVYFQGRMDLRSNGSGKKIVETPVQEFLVRNVPL